MAEQTIPPYGSVESYARILRGARSDWLELSALAIVQVIAADDHWPDADKLARIRNVVAAAEQVRSVTPMPAADRPAEPVSESR